jgi:hypothetical protein
MEVYFHLFIVLTIGGDEGLLLPAARFTPGNRAVVTLGIGDWVNPRRGLKFSKKLKAFYPCWSLAVI